MDTIRKILNILAVIGKIAAGILKEFENDNSNEIISTPETGSEESATTGAKPKRASRNGGAKRS